VFFCCDWGIRQYADPEFGTSFSWDVPLLEGYDYEFLPIARRPARLTFWSLDNPSVGEALDRFDPHLVQVFGYAHRTNWRAAGWARTSRTPLLIYSDSNVRARTASWKALTKRAVVSQFYRRVDGALYVGDNNKAYHRRYGIPEERLFAGVYPVDRQRLLSRVPDRANVRIALRRRLGIPDDAFVVMFCGKYSARKRPVDLVAAAWAAAQSGLPVWSLLVGEGAERSAIEEFRRRNHVTNAVLTGFVNQSSIPEYYATSDAIAVTSAYDPHPLVVTEAACFGLPVIVSDRVGCIGPNDTAQPGVNATVYPHAHIDQLRQAISSLCANPELCRRMSAASASISNRQDATTAASALTAAAGQLLELGLRLPS
jgi:glycosyltransferase involved in cell wall biosynthesis